VIATVKGDVHDIGKNIVAVVLGCNNYRCLHCHFPKREKDDRCYEPFISINFYVKLGTVVVFTIVCLYAVSVWWACDENANSF